VTIYRVEMVMDGRVIQERMFINEAAAKRCGEDMRSRARPETWVLIHTFCGADELHQTQTKICKHGE